MPGNSELGSSRRGEAVGACTRLSGTGRLDECVWCKMPRYVIIHFYVKVSLGEVGSWLAA